MLEKNRQKKLLAGFDRMARSVRLRLLEHYPAKLVWGAIADTRRELEALIPSIPYIGEKHVWQSNLDTSTMYLALYRTLKKRGFTVNEAAQMTYVIFEAYLKSFPNLLRRVYPWYYFSPLYQNRLRHAAAASQLRQYPEDWVFTYVEGDSFTFDTGIDITECAILKFSLAQGTEEFVPQLCKLDHAMGKYLGLGFARRGTLAEGATVCDCRWKRGAETPNWTPVIDPVYKEETWKPSLNNT